VDSRFPDFQELDLGPGRDYQDVTGTWELDFFLFLNLGTVFLALRKETMTEQTLPPALLLGIRRPEFSPHSQCKLWRCSTHSELRNLNIIKLLPQSMRLGAVPICCFPKTVCPQESGNSLYQRTLSVLIITDP
uniref:Uncharacterized protein n=1 Tax=Balaenoptera musculus TaxID=9771 RepID=A0A8C0D692_BALMU